MTMDAAIVRASLLTPGPFGRWGLPILNWGPPSVAKTASTHAIAEDVGLRVETLLGSTRQVEDFLGNPYLMDVGIVDGTGTRRTVKATGHAMPDWAIRAFNDPFTVIHLDELSLTSTETQKGILRLVHEGFVGEVELPKTIRFMASANPAGMANGTFDMSPPLVSRWGHAMTGVDEMLQKVTLGQGFVEDWAKWALMSGGERPVGYVPEPQDSRAERVEEAQNFVMESWSQTYREIRADVASFMMSTAGGISALHDMPPCDTIRPGVAWANPRMWEYAMRAMAAGKIHHLTEMQTHQWAGMFVGVGIIAKFAFFQKDLNLPTPSDFLSGNVQYTHDPYKLDRTMSLLNACAVHICAPQCTNSSVKEGTFWSFVTTLATSCGDICIPAIHLMIGARKVHNKMASTALVAFHPMLKAAGVVK